MRFNLTLNKTGKSRYIPVDYQYYSGAWIYKIIGKADKKLASFLHTSGYGEGSKKFKLFNYSPLYFNVYKLWKEKQLFELLQDQVSFQVSFHIDKIAEGFIKGLFLDQNIYIGNGDIGSNFNVNRVEALAMPLFTGKMMYRLQSALVLSIKQKNNNPLYLSPDDNNYNHYFIKHLQQKFSGVLAAQSLIFEKVQENKEQTWDFKILSQYRSRLHTIKPGRKEQTRVRGFIYDFELTAPVEIHEMAYNCGFGEKNSTGFGWAEVMEKPVSV